MGAAFSADTSDGIGSGSNLNVDPVNNVGLNPQGAESYSQAKQVPPPLPHLSAIEQAVSAAGQPAAPVMGPPPLPGELTTESARQAVESAFNSVPFNPANNPEVGIGATPMGPQMHQPPPQAPVQPPVYDTGTPSLSLPPVPNGMPMMQPPPDQAPPPPATPPPPTPPPFMPPPTL
jgi:hypothetical protein